MKSVVIYASHQGNTQKIAEEIAQTLRGQGEVSLYAVEDAPDHLPESDLLLIGGPTERHTMTAPMSEFLDRVAPSSVFGRCVATFDTRLAWPMILSGSAAESIANRLEAAGADLCELPESFIVTMEPRLKPGEIARAADWALRVASKAGVHKRAILAA